MPICERDISARSTRGAHSLTDVRARYWLTCEKWHADDCRPMTVKAWVFNPQVQWSQSSYV